MSSPVTFPDGDVRIADPSDGGVCCRRCEDAALAQLPEIDRVLKRTFVVCTTCGNKRCPKATLHDNVCTGSNDSGQPGSDYA